MMDQFLKLYTISFFSALDTSCSTTGLAGEYPSCSCHQQNRPADRGAEIHFTGGVHSPAENTRAGKSELQNMAKALEQTITNIDFERHCV